MKTLVAAHDELLQKGTLETWMIPQNMNCRAARACWHIKPLYIVGDLLTLQQSQLSTHGDNTCYSIASPNEEKAKTPFQHILCSRAIV